MPKNTDRILSLDVFRGITVVLMILVNSPGTHFPYPILHHAAWNGCTFADLVFPSFLFIVGLTTVISLQKQKDQSVMTLSRLIFKRTLLLFLVGLMLNAFPHHLDLSNLRYYGVLQRIAMCYAVCAILYLNTNFKTQFLIFLLLIWVYWLVMTVLHIPGVDVNKLFGKHYDPEGLLSTIPAIATTLIGLLFGQYLLNSDSNKQEKLFVMIACSWLLFITGWLWNYTFPINKMLWTSSYVLWTGGYALMAFSLCYLIIDIWGYDKWSWPFKAFGVNALFIYVVHVLLLKVQGPLRYQITNYLFSSYSPANAALFYAEIFILINFLIAWLLYRRQIFIKL